MANLMMLDVFLKVFRYQNLQINLNFIFIHAFLCQDLENMAHVQNGLSQRTPETNTLIFMSYDFF